MGTRTYRIGQIVPSSNTTMETEIPAMFRARETVEPERFTFHSDYIEAEGIEVVDSISLEIADNVEVGRRDPMALVDIYRHLKLDGADAVVLSACVQMPSLAAIPVVEEECGLPVISAAVCTAYQMLQRLGLKTYVPGAGSLLSGLRD